jgi:hypothetical protein
MKKMNQGYITTQLSKFQKFTKLCTHCHMIKIITTSIITKKGFNILVLAQEIKMYLNFLKNHLRQQHFYLKKYHEHHGH